MQTETSVRFFEFDAAKAGPWVPAAAALLVQSSVALSVEAVTLIGLTPDVLGAVPAGASATYATQHAFVRLVATGVGTASIAASLPGGGSGGAGTGATEATAAQMLTALQSIDAGTPAAPLAQGLTDAELRAAPLPLPTGAATDATLQAVRDRLPSTPLVQSLTDVQLRAAAVPVSMAALPAGAATAAAQASALARVSRFDSLALRNLDETTAAGVTYLLKLQTTAGEGPTWLIQRIDATSFGYAGPANNPGQASAAAAWTARTTLVYGLPLEA